MSAMSRCLPTAVVAEHGRDECDEQVPGNVTPGTQISKMEGNPDAGAMSRYLPMAHIRGNTNSRSQMQIFQIEICTYLPLLAWLVI